jgi:WD40 repeat protein
MRYSPDGRWLAVGSHDNGIYIYDASTYQLTGKKLVHSSYVTELDWSLDSTALHSCCGAYELIFWTVSDAGKLKHNPSGATEHRDEVWDTWSTHFGWPVQGIFGNIIDYTHVNRVDRSLDRSTFAVANDYGLVELFRNPNTKETRSKAYKAHSEHVTNVKWTYDNQFILSAGGYDQCIMQWRITS